MEKIAILLAPGFEETEVIVPMDVLRRCGLNALLIAVDGTPSVTGTHGAALVADGALADADPAEFSAVILPGGLPGSTNLRDNPAVIDFVNTVYGAGGFACAICAAPVALQRAGLLKDCTFTCYPGMEEQMGKADLCSVSAITDGKVITGRSAGTAFDFALELVEAMCGAEKARAVAKEVVYR